MKVPGSSAGEVSSCTACSSSSRVWRTGSDVGLRGEAVVLMLLSVFSPGAKFISQYMPFCQYVLFILFLLVRSLLASAAPRPPSVYRVPLGSVDRQGLGQCLPHVFVFIALMAYFVFIHTVFIAFLAYFFFIHTGHRLLRHRSPGHL